MIVGNACDEIARQQAFALVRKPADQSKLAECKSIGPKPTDCPRRDLGGLLSVKRSAWLPARDRLSYFLDWLPAAFRKAFVNGRVDFRVVLIEQRRVRPTHSLD